ncbi:hypothetical protein B0T17DRAFT_658441 [Bombardia bombarda]|uniref:Nephrocystin 3-like N-terminal domain-containing protein n=1 Tax=Bombardia bombarda TaxID=252184 RepID=A0AA39TKL0_9PEZI|nr:hypothetical protein B0T17DRAFT_658441 [Bombardia bombarda]
MLNPRVPFRKRLRGIFPKLLSDGGEGSAEGEARRLANIAAKFYPAATIVLGLVSLSAEAASFLPLKIAANGLQQVIVLATKIHDRSEDVLCQLELLTDYGPFLDNLRELVNNFRLLEIATDFFIAMMDFLRKSLDYLDKWAVMKLIDESWEESKKALELSRKRLDGQVQRDMQISFFNWIEQESNSRVISFLSTDLSHRGKQHHYREHSMPHTGQWVLDNEIFKRWQTLSAKAVLCCVGLPGAGKTYIASRIITHLEDSRNGQLFANPRAKVGIAYLYCSIDNEALQTTIGFISSIARQLVETPVTRPNSVMKEAESFRKQHSGRPARLSDYVELIKSLLCHLDDALVVVDALDECSEYDQNNIKELKK